MKKTKKHLIVGQEKVMADIVVHKNCPICKIPLSNAVIYNTEVDYCPKCYGLWFEEGELQFAKNAKDENLKWLDIDLWKDESKFKVSYGIRLCPYCRMPLYEVYYGNSKVIVDVCNLCHGVWLDRAEFRKIIDWLKEKADYETMNNYFQNIFRQTAEVFSGPKSIREEITDVIMVLNILGYKVASQSPNLANIARIVKIALPK